MENKRIGNIVYVANTGTEYHLEQQVASVEDIGVFLQYSLDENYKEELNYSNYKITNDENGSKLVITNAEAIEGVLNLKIIYPLKELNLESENNLTLEALLQDIKSLKDRNYFLEKLIEQRVVMSEDYYTDTQLPIPKEGKFWTLVNGVPTLQDWTEFVTWEDAGLINDRTRVLNLKYSLSPEQTLINTGLKEIPNSSLCFIDRVLVESASNIGLTDGDYFIYSENNEVKIAVKQTFKNTSFNLFYNIITEDSTGGEGSTVEGLNTRLEKFENVQELQSSTSSELFENKVFYLKGYYSSGDGAGHFRVVSNTQKSTSITLTNGLYANLINYNYVEAIHCGAKGDGVTDDYNIIINIINDANAIILESNRNFRISSSLVLTKDLYIISKNGKASLTSGTGGSGTLINTNGFNFNISNIKFSTERTGETAIYSVNAKNINVLNCEFYGFYKSIKTLDTELVYIYDCTFVFMRGFFTDIKNSEYCLFNICSFDNSNNASIIEQNINIINNVKKVYFKECIFTKILDLNCIKTIDCKSVAINNSIFNEVNTCVNTENTDSILFKNNDCNKIYNSTYNEVSTIKTVNCNLINVSDNNISEYDFSLLFLESSQTAALTNNFYKSDILTCKLVNINYEKCHIYNNEGFSEGFRVLHNLGSESTLTSTTGILFKKGDIWFTNGFMKNNLRTLLYQRETNGTTNTVGSDWTIIYAESGATPTPDLSLQLENNNQTVITLQGSTLIPTSIDWVSSEVEGFTLDAINGTITATRSGRAMFTFAGIATGGNNKSYTGYLMKNPNLTTPTVATSVLTSPVDSGASGKFFITGFQKIISFNSGDKFKIYFSGTTGEILTFPTKFVRFSIEGLRK